ncbi:MAG: RHS repeat-associated core domain-containing protein [Bacteroidota bacterium]|nr:RHS repeat-associated core domain-containing protein [Bacteroidota bacterium]
MLSCQKHSNINAAVCSAWDKGYRFGFNGEEIDKGSEGMGGGGSTYDYGFRIYNPSLGRFLSVDPLAPEYPYYSAYQFSGNMPIWCIDIDGLEPLVSISTDKDNNVTKIKITYHLFVVSKSKEVTSEQLLIDFDMSNIVQYYPNVTIDGIEIEWDIKVTPCKTMKEARREKRKLGYGEFAIYKDKNKKERSEHGRKGNLDQHKIYLGYGENNKFAKPFIVAHEIGHGIGYDERYIDPDEYNNENLIKTLDGKEIDNDGKSLSLDGYQNDLMGGASAPLNSSSISRLISNVVEKFKKDGKKTYTGPPVKLKNDDWYKEFAGKTTKLHQMKFNENTGNVESTGKNWDVKVEPKE